MTRHITKTGYEHIAFAVSILLEDYEKQYQKQLKGNDNSKQWLLRGKVLGIQDTVYYLAQAFKLDNPKFDEQKFSELCGVRLDRPKMYTCDNHRNYNHDCVECWEANAEIK